MPATAPEQDATEDFELACERRFVEVAKGFVDGGVPVRTNTEFPGSDDEPALYLAVELGDEVAPGLGYFRCEVSVSLEMGEHCEDPKWNRTWGQIYQAFGDGVDGDDPLEDRLSAGRVKLMEGTEPIADRESRFDLENGARIYTFTAPLGMYDR